QHPVVAALVFGEPLLCAEAKPVLMDDARTELARDVACVVSAAAIDDYDLIDPIFHSFQRAPDAVRLVLRDEEARKRCACRRCGAPRFPFGRCAHTRSWRASAVWPSRNAKAPSSEPR